MMFLFRDNYMPDALTRYRCVHKQPTIWQGSFNGHPGDVCQMSYNQFKVIKTANPDKVMRLSQIDLTNNDVIHAWALCGSIPIITYKPSRHVVPSNYTEPYYGSLYIDLNSKTYIQPSNYAVDSDSESWSEGRGTAIHELVYDDAESDDSDVSE